MCVIGVCMSIRVPQCCTRGRSSSASDVYKGRPVSPVVHVGHVGPVRLAGIVGHVGPVGIAGPVGHVGPVGPVSHVAPVAGSYTQLRAHETRHDIVCRLLLEKKKKDISSSKQIAV